MPAKELALLASGQASSTFDVLTEHCKVEVAHAAKAQRALAALASTNKQLCSLSRGEVPLTLRVVDAADASLLANSLKRPDLPFTGCTQLDVAVAAPAALDAVAGIFSAAQQYPALRQLQLQLDKELFDYNPFPLDHIVEQPDRTAENQQLASVHSGLLGLQQLRRLDLTAWEMGADVAGRMTQLVQLTRLKLDVRAWLPHCALAAPALRLLTNLLELQMCNPPEVQSAAGAYCLPGSLTRLFINCQHGGGGRERYVPKAAPLASWVTHLPGCSQLQQLALEYNLCVDVSIDPSALVLELKQHSRQLRSLSLTHPVAEWWQPNRHHHQQPQQQQPGALPWEMLSKALPGLEFLRAPSVLLVSGQPDWQHLAAWQGLTKLGAHFKCVPVLPVGTSLGLLELVDCWVELDGHDLGQLLLALPSLQRATVADWRPPEPLAVLGANAQLAPHPGLKVFGIRCSTEWDQQAAGAFAALAPVLGGVADLSVAWPFCSPFPDLSQCAALTALKFMYMSPGPCFHGHEAKYMSMLAPLVHLRRLDLSSAYQLSAQAAVRLQHLLPQLQHLSMHQCGSPLCTPIALGPCVQSLSKHKLEVRAFRRVQRQLRPDLRLRVFMEYSWHSGTHVVRVLQA